MADLVDPVPLHQMLGLRYQAPEPGDGHAEVRMPVKPEALGFTGSLHGGAIATLIDLACALAAVGISGFEPAKETMVTSDMHVRYLGRPRTETVIAKSDVVKRGKQLIVVTCDVVDEDDHLVAHADFSMMIVPLRTPMDESQPVVPGAAEL